MLLAIARDEFSFEFGDDPSNEMTPSFRPFEFREGFPTWVEGALLLLACPGLDLDGLLGVCCIEEDSLDGGEMSSWVLAA